MRTRQLSYEEMFGMEVRLTGALLFLATLIKSGATKIFKTITTPFIEPWTSCVNCIRILFKAGTNLLFSATKPLDIIWHTVIQPLAQRVGTFLTSTSGFQFVKTMVEKITDRLASLLVKRNSDGTPTKQKHPRLLPLLCFIEVWERFGFYLMIALFVIYLKEKHGFTEDSANFIYGNFNALIYLTPLLGGWLADRFLGFYRCTLIGLALMGLGYHFMGGAGTHAVVYTSMALIIFGNGFFKPNMSTLVGNLYMKGDPRRDEGFSKFYVGINVGAFGSGLVADFGRTLLGLSWQQTFDIAAVGMVFGFIISVIFRNALHRISEGGVALEVTKLDEEKLNHQISKIFIALGILAGIIALFWAAFHQNGSTLSFWAKKHTLPFTIPFVNYTVGPFFYASVNPFFIITMTPVVNRFYAFLRQRGLEPSTPVKMLIGMLLTATSYSIMVVASLVGGNTGKVDAGWLIACYFVITLGELHISPMGLSTVSKMAPQKYRGVAMGIWMASTFVGNFLCGLVGKLWWTKIPNSSFFLILVGTSIFATTLLFVSLRFLNRMVPSPSQEPTTTQANAAALPSS